MPIPAVLVPVVSYAAHIVELKVLPVVVPFALKHAAVIDPLIRAGIKGSYIYGRLRPNIPILLMRKVGFSTVKSYAILGGILAVSPFIGMAIEKHNDDKEKKVVESDE